MIILQVAGIYEDEAASAKQACCYITTDEELLQRNYVDKSAVSSTQVVEDIDHQSRGMVDSGRIDVEILDDLRHLRRLTKLQWISS